MDHTCLGACHPCGQPEWSFRLLASKQPRLYAGGLSYQATTLTLICFLKEPQLKARPSAEMGSFGQLFLPLLCTIANELMLHVQHGEGSRKYCPSDTILLTHLPSVSLETWSSSECHEKLGSVASQRFHGYYKHVGREIGYGVENVPEVVCKGLKYSFD